MEEKTSERHASDLLIACSAGHFGRHQTQGYSPTRRPTHPRGLTGAHGYSREVRAFEDRPEQQRRAARARRASFARWFVCLFRWSEPEDSAAMARRERVRSLAVLQHVARR